MDANELGRWTRFAAKGGIGKCTALQDCVAEESEDLMFMKDDEITVLMQLTDQEDTYLGYCEGVVGRFHGPSVRFHARLKKPVMAKRASAHRSASASSPSRSRPSSSQSALTVFARDSVSPYVGSAHFSPAPTRASSPRMSYSYSNSSSVVTEASSEGVLSESSSAAHERALSASPTQDDGFHTRSASNFSISKALESVSLDPADYGESNNVIAGSAHPGSPIGHVGVSALELRHNDFNALSQPLVSPLNIRKQSGTPKPIETVTSDDHGLTGQREDAHQSVSFDTEDSSRFSIAMSDGIAGIGLSLLQGFAGGAGDDGASMLSSRSSTNTPQLNDDGQMSVPGSPESTVEGHAAPAASITLSDAVSESQYSGNAGSPQSSRRSLADFAPPAPPYARDSARMSRTSMHPSITDSEFGGSDWEGASDIYDNYRYSRFSVASKMSGMSQGSLPLAGSSSDIPPVPVELQSPGPRLDVGASGNSLETPRNEGQSSPGARTSPPDAVNLGGTQRSSQRSPLADVSDRIMKDRPSPLELVGGRASPLLHAAFGSPQGPATPLSMNSSVSPAPRSPNGSTSLPSAESSLTSFRMQQERGLHPSSPIIRPSRESFVRVSVPERLFGHDIVIEDDESSSPEIVSPVESSTSPSTDSSFGISQDQMMPSPHELAPPPYTSMSPTATPSGPSSLAQYTNSSAPIPRPANTRGPPADAGNRQSLFQPHPHAPKPAQTPVGPMYGRQPSGAPGPHPHQAGPTHGSALQTLSMAVALSHTRRTTIYARFEYDLTSSTGPVPISFSLEPPMNIPANRPGSTKPHALASRSNSPAAFGNGHVASERAEAQTQKPRDQDRAFNGHDTTSKVIPRSNFVPQAPGQRPRSRSFSGFDTRSTDALTFEGPSTIDGHVAVTNGSLPIVTKRSKSASATPVAAVSPLPVPSPQRASVSHSTTVVRTVQKPSPLSYSQNNIVAPSPSPSPPLSPRNPIAVPLVSSPVMSTRGTPMVRMTSFDSTSVSDVSHKDTTEGEHVRHQSRGTLSSEKSRSSPPSSPRSPTSFSSVSPALRHSRSSILTGSKSTVGNVLPRSRVSSQGRPSLEQALRRPHDLQLNISSALSVSDVSEPGSPFLHAGSSRSRVSSSAQRSQNSDRLFQHGDKSPVSSVFSFENPHDHKTVSVKDMDFELINPTIPQSPLAASSPELPSLSASSRAEDSPSPTMAGTSVLSLQATLAGPSIESKVPKTVDAADLDAHRHRELRWISTMSSIPASQARKSKKVRKLVLEGVPASVRYLVWAHLTDSKAKRMNGLYGRLGKREKVGPIANIEEDAQRVFPDQPLQDQSLVNLLQAYLSMVPDVQYSRGLAMVASQLLRQSPEEDAFWTFVSLMDSHLRPYFSLNSVQLDVDASLFCRAVESSDAALSRKIFVDMAISPISICRPWFTCVFADSFSSEYLHRIWDIFLFEGVTVLFRVGLAIVSCCRNILLQCSGQEALLTTLSRPPVTCLPSTPDAFLELVFSVKLKDEDLRKQRTKMEAQVKRQTQSRHPILSSTVGPRGSTPPISLPKS